MADTRTAPRSHRLIERQVLIQLDHDADSEAAIDAEEYFAWCYDDMVDWPSRYHCGPDRDDSHLLHGPLMTGIWPQHEPMLGPLTAERARTVEMMHALLRSPEEETP